MNREAEFVIYEFNDEAGSRPRGSEVGRVTVSTHKWGPSNAIQKFVRESRPPAGKYLVAGDQHSVHSHGPWGPGRFNVYVVSYPEYTIEGTGPGGVQLYGDRPIESVPSPSDVPQVTLTKGIL